MKFSNCKLFLTTQRSFHEILRQQSTSWIEPVGYRTQVNVYNPIKKSIVPLILKNDGVATWYMCGPTIYDSAHIGHACTYVRFDIIRRILTNFFNIHVVSIMGITDIDDKIIKRSQDRKEDWKQLTKRYEQEFFKEMNLLNIMSPYLYCRVTDYVPQIVEFVNTILLNNGAYVGQDGSVYFDTSRYSRYGKLQKPHSSETHSVKNSTTDFALWKASKPGEPSWESPWGPGRPGWHIECSTIASLTLGGNIDIHSGGIDLLFPHHENEEAQSCCYHCVDQWINYWLHSGHLYLTGAKKMSKSLQNTISIKEILEKYSANQFRFLCLLTHYRNGIEFSDEKMENAVTTLNKLNNFLGDCRNYVSGRLTLGNVDETVVFHALKMTREKVRASLADDFDTTKAIFAIQELTAVVNKMINQSPKSTSGAFFRNPSCIAAVANYIEKTLASLGISETECAQTSQNELIDIIDNFVDFRKSVRNRALEMEVKDNILLKACDVARSNLAACGVKVKDYKNTSIWSPMENSQSIKKTNKRELRILLSGLKIRKKIKHIGGNEITDSA